MCLSTIDALLVKWSMLHKFGLTKAFKKVGEPAKPPVPDCWTLEDDNLFQAIMPSYYPPENDFPTAKPR